MEDGMQELDLATLGGGAAIERFQDELERVVANILDPNTEATKVRKITLTVSLKPHESREFAQAALRVTSSLAPAKDVGELAFFGRMRTGEIVATRRDPRQMEIGEEGEPDVRPINLHAHQGGAR